MNTALPPRPLASCLSPPSSVAPIHGPTARREGGGHGPAYLEPEEEGARARPVSTSRPGTCRASKRTGMHGVPTTNTPTAPARSAGSHREWSVRKVQGHIDPMSPMIGRRWWRGRRGGQIRSRRSTRSVPKSTSCPPCETPHLPTASITMMRPAHSPIAQSVGSLSPGRSPGGNARISWGNPYGWKSCAASEARCLIAFRVRRRTSSGVDSGSCASQFATQPSPFFSTMRMVAPSFRALSIHCRRAPASTWYMAARDSAMTRIIHNSAGTLRNIVRATPSDIVRSSFQGHTVLAAVSCSSKMAARTPCRRGRARRDRWERLQPLA